VHSSWQDCEAFLQGQRRFAFTTRGSAVHSHPAFQRGDVFLFGPETRGLPDAMLEALPTERRLRIPMLPHSRSLNLSNSVAVVVYEAWRQLGYAGSSPGPTGSLR
jgi:tRNA (cytidine/uridine-2'-O-)-methyltransferase